MNKKKYWSSDSLVQTQKPEVQDNQEINVFPYDSLIVKIMSLRLAHEDPKYFAIKVTFLDQLIIHAIIKSIGDRDDEPTNSIIDGTMNYDPSDYEKMCLFADSPLVVHIQTLKNMDENTMKTLRGQGDENRNSESRSVKSFSAQDLDISCCNIDILSMFLAEKGCECLQKTCITKRMEPLIMPLLKNRKSWDTLPLLTIELTAERDARNFEHHKVLNNANWMKLTLVAAYNMYIPYERNYVYTAASRTPFYCDPDVQNIGVVTFSQGSKEAPRFNCTSFFPKWESLRLGGNLFTHGDQKLHYNLEDIQNDNSLDLQFYLNSVPPDHTSVWGSFHRTLMLKNAEKWLWDHIRVNKWPFEIHIYGENGGYSFMAFLNLFRLLYPGVTTLRLAVPLQWINEDTMMNECACDLLLTPNDGPPSITNERLLPSPISTAQKAGTKPTTDSVTVSVTNLTDDIWKATGADTKDAFILVEVQLGRPLKKIVKPPRILKDELSKMLTDLEKEYSQKRKCTGRGQQEKDWQQTIRNAANFLQKVPYYGPIEFCTFNRQLSGTRTRVELMTSCVQDAAIFVNNNFVVHQYLHSEEAFEELVMVAHACLIKSACSTLIGVDQWKVIDMPVRAARHARQMQDTKHAMELYLRLVVEEPRNADHWRELSTCLKEIDRDWATVCLNKSVVLDPRHPLTLLSKGAMLYEESPTIAEPFFIALLAFNPLWSVMWVIVGVYFYERELYHVADATIQYAQQCRGIHYLDEQTYKRVWEHELGDWWDSTPMPFGTSLYMDAADLLLRLRAIPLAEVCLARELSEFGESVEYYHLLGLCCRLRGDYEEALCHIHVGLDKYGEVNYLRCLEAECLHRLCNYIGAINSFHKADGCIGPFSKLMSLACEDSQRARSVLVGLVRRQPSAYAWTALAEDWVMKSRTCEYPKEGDQMTAGKGVMHEQTKTKSCAIASAVQALKIDRRAGRAWAMLGSLVKPSARRHYCYHMANICGWEINEKEIRETEMPKKTSVCHQVGTPLDCRCGMCGSIRL